MLVMIENILDDDSLRTALEVIDDAKFGDGRLSAGSMAACVKDNEEVEPRESAVAAVNALVGARLHSHPTFQAATMPLKLASFTLARYLAGMHYGPHTDDPIMGTAGAHLRADIAVTVFLTPPSSYAGGELVIKTAFGEARHKGEAGAALVYPASSLHRVEPVTDGERKVALTWVQSMVRDGAQREVLYDLWSAREALRGGLPEAQVTSEIDRVYAQLVRMWAEL
jgi:PKHD-type hydroxylase